MRPTLCNTATLKSPFTRQIGTSLLLALALLLIASTQTTFADIGAQEDSPVSEATPLSDSFLAEYERLSEPAGEEESVPIEGTDGGSLAGRLLISMMVIVGLIYASFWIYRQAIARRNPTANAADASSLLAIQESQSLGPNQKLHVVRMGEEVLLLGATEHSISFLARYGSDFDPASFAGQLQQARAEVSTASVPLEESLEQMRRIQPWRSGGDD